jgi:hypothetical protein
VNYGFVVPRSKTVEIGGTSLTRDTLRLDIQAQSRADVRALLFQITTEEVDQQLNINNPPRMVEVDGKTNRSIQSVERKAVVVFGVQLARTAMAVVEQALFDGIRKMTTARSGTLSDRSNWQWTLLAAGTAKRITSPDQLDNFGVSSDRLILTPDNIPYAAIVNSYVVRSGGLSLSGRKSAQNKTGRVAVKDQRLGFLAYATRTVRRRPEFRQFAVYAAFSRQGTYLGNQGVPMIVIRPKSKLERFSPGRR